MGAYDQYFDNNLLCDMSNPTDNPEPLNYNKEAKPLQKVVHIPMSAIYLSYLTFLFYQNFAFSILYNYFYLATDGNFGIATPILILRGLVCV